MPHNYEADFEFPAYPHCSFTVEWTMNPGLPRTWEDPGEPPHIEGMEIYEGGFRIIDAPDDLVALIEKAIWDHMGNLDDGDDRSDRHFEQAGDR